jgi:hypothetical protein
MEFDKDKLVQILKEILKIDRSSTIEWVNSEEKYCEPHRHFEAIISEAPLNTHPFAIGYFEVPDYETTFTLLRKFGPLSDSLVTYLKTSFSQNKPRYLTICNTHDSWASSRINVTSYPML